MKHKYLLIALFLSQFSFAEQQIPKELYNTLWNEISKARSVTFNELTSNSEFSGCELVFKYPLRDFRYFDGEPIVVTGSVVNNYLVGKAFSFFLKVQPNRVVYNNTTKDLQFKTLKPKTASLVVNNLNLKKFEHINFECSDGGLCIGYSDTTEKLELVKKLFENFPFDAQVVYSMGNPGVDIKFKISELESTAKEREQFTKCMNKTLEAMLDNLNAKSSKK